MTTTTTSPLKRQRDPDAARLFGHVRKMRKLMQDPAPVCLPIHYDPEFASNSHRNFCTNFSRAQLNLITIQRITFIPYQDRNLYQIPISSSKKVRNDPKFIVGKHAKYWDDSLIFPEFNIRKTISPNDPFAMTRIQTQFEANYKLLQMYLLQSRSQADFRFLQSQIKRNPKIDRVATIKKINQEFLRFHFDSINTSWKMLPPISVEAHKVEYYLYMYYDFLVYGAKTRDRKYLQWMIMENDFKPTKAITIAPSARMIIKTFASCIHRKLDRINPAVYYYNAICKEFKFIFPKGCSDKLTLLGKLNYEKAGFINKCIETEYKTNLPKILNLPHFFE